VGPAAAASAEAADQEAGPLRDEYYKWGRVLRNYHMEPPGD